MIIIRFIINTRRKRTARGLLDLLVLSVGIFTKDLTSFPSLLVRKQHVGGDGLGSKADQQWRDCGIESTLAAREPIGTMLRNTLLPPQSISTKG